MMLPTWGPAFRVDVGLGPVPASAEEVLLEMGSALDGLQPRLWRQDAGLRVSLTVAADDLWLAVLQSLAALHATGYHAVSLDVRAVERP